MKINKITIKQGKKEVVLDEYIDEINVAMENGEEFDKIIGRYIPNIVEKYELEPTAFDITTDVEEDFQ